MVNDKLEAINQAIIVAFFESICINRHI